MSIQSLSLMCCSRKSSEIKQPVRPTPALGEEEGKREEGRKEERSEEKEEEESSERREGEREGREKNCETQSTKAMLFFIINKALSLPLILLSPNFDL